MKWRRGRKSGIISATRMVVNQCNILCIWHIWSKNGESQCHHTGGSDKKVLPVDFFHERGYHQVASSIAKLQKNRIKQSHNLLCIYSLVHINKSKVLHKTEVTWFLMARRPLKISQRSQPHSIRFFNTFTAKIGRFFTPQSVFKVFDFLTFSSKTYDIFNFFLQNNPLVEKRKLSKISLVQSFELHTSDSCYWHDLYLGFILLV